MKKTVCGILAFIMAVSVCVINGAAYTEVSAAVGGVEFRYHEENVISFNPKGLGERGQGNVSETVFSWPTVASGSTMNGGTYTLTYAYKNGKYVEAKFDMTPNAVTVSYQILNGPGNPDDLFKIPATGTKLENIRCYVSGEIQDINLNNSHGYDTNDVKTVKRALSNEELMAFTVYSGTEPNILEIETVKVFWFEGRIYYSTNQAHPSQRIYSFNLKGELQNGAVYTTLGADGKTFRVSTGYDSAASDQISIISTAEGGTIIDKVANPDQTLWPGSKSVVQFTIKIPQKWDSSANAFVDIEEADNVGLFMSLDLNDSVSVANLLKSESKGGDGAYQYTYDAANPGYGVLEIIGRKAGSIFSGAYFYLETMDKLATDYEKVHGDDTTFGTYDVYTLLSYRIEKIDVDSYIAEITNPFRIFNPSGTGANIQGKYTIERALSTSFAPVAELVVNAANENEKTLTMPVPLTTHDPNNQAWIYRIVFTPAGSTASIQSQSVNYLQTDTMDRLQTPSDFSVLNVITVATDDNGAAQDYARVKFAFITGYEEVLENIAKKGVQYIDYEFYASKTPNNGSPAQFMTLRLYIQEPPSASDPVVYNAEVVYPADPNKKIGLIDWDYFQEWRSVGGTLMPFGLVNAEVNIPVGKETNSGNAVLFYPTSYYAKIGGTYDVPGMNPGDFDTINTALSSETSLNISSPAMDEVPAPISFSAEKNAASTKDSFDLSWNISIPSVFRYMDYTMNPKKKTLDNPSVTYGVYLAQDYDNMEAFASGYPVIPQNIDIREIAIDTTVPGWSGVIDVSALETDALQFLRDGGIYHLTGLVQKDFTPQDSMRNNLTLSYGVRLSKLDSNTSYFAAACTELIPYDTKWDTAESVIGVPETVGISGTTRQPVVVGGPDADSLASKLTSVKPITTTPDIKPPSQDEFEPPAPVGLTGVKKSDGADVYWNRLQQSELPSDIDPDIFEYEILRVKSNALSDDFLTNKGTLSAVISHITTNYSQMELAAWRTDLFDAAGSNSLQELSGNSTVYPGDVTFNRTNARNTLSDGSAQPGTMYVYYVRTIQKMDKTSTDDNNILKYSVWTRISVTTDTLKRPENLAAVSLGSYNIMTEAYLTFDAPVPKADLTNGAFTISYSIKSDAGDWGKEDNIPAGNLEDGVTPVDDPDGYFKYFYTATGLKSGSTYYFRFRITDNKTGDKSPWSDELQYRTEFDPDEPVDESEKWIDYFREKLQELLKKPYWTLRSNSQTSFEAAYRDSMINGVIGGAVDGVITLGREGVREQAYYIPAKAYAKTVAAGKGLKIVSENVTEIIPAGVIDANSTQAVRDIIAQQNDNKIKDYYILLSLTLSGTGETVNGNPSLTDRIAISVKTVGFNELEALWDAEITSRLKVIINDENALSRYFSRIRNAVNSGSSNEDMVKLIDTLVSEVERDFDDEVSDSFNDNRQYEYEANSFVTPVRIVAVPKQQAGQTNIAGYQLVQGQWQSIPATPYGTGKSILPSAPGTFIFSGATVNIQGINDMQNGDAITNVVLKYGLDDFLGKGQVNTYVPLTNDALIGSVARMAGASNTQDAAAFLRGKGVTVSARNSYSAATNETAVYMLMSLYEIKTNTKVSTIRITNQNIVKNIPGIGANYVPYYKAAYHIGIMDKNYMPKEQMTVKDFLQILGKLAGKIKL